ncbi:hypothetical protein NCCP2716_15900 [Sporosarcina sp. NCCP-2716]|uniref:DUF4230 domain-containing protein n=1 Tax=Sporosarcina sp. NCCP-2716 TaxID=2943679 RepID=UPI00203D8BE4|nr:DUF4230 domain-containing protein [Sporosarcina sp. NCCP-2716]GKV69092.1 hypothetical protein NCCP2716_15900 [Sporosarcina sp. NCCP-2716]
MPPNTPPDDDRRLQEVERLLKELKASDDEKAVTVEEAGGRTRKERRNVWQLLGVFFSLWRKSFLLIALAVLLLVVTLPFLAFYLLKQGSTATEQKTSFLEQIRDLNEMATAEAYTKVIIERQDNELFGQSIGLNLPGTKRQLLVVIPGAIKAGVDFTSVDKKDITINEDAKTAELTLPKPEFLGGAEIFFDQVEVYSYEGAFRQKADIEEAYDLADEAKKMIREESAGQGVLETAERNAEQTLREMFSFAGYDVTIKFKE